MLPPPLRTSLPNRPFNPSARFRPPTLGVGKRDDEKNTVNCVAVCFPFRRRRDGDDRSVAGLCCRRPYRSAQRSCAALADVGGSHCRVQDVPSRLRSPGVARAALPIGGVRFNYRHRRRPCCPPPPLRPLATRGGLLGGWRVVARVPASLLLVDPGLRSAPVPL